MTGKNEPLAACTSSSLLPSSRRLVTLSPGHLVTLLLRYLVILSIVVPPLLLALILWGTFDLKLRNLDHTALTCWDEVFHAVVAQNLLKHPLKPTLIDVPYLPYDKAKWEGNHIWLHKPILSLWQIAISLAVLGVNAFAVRLPSVILSTGAVLLTYLIGKELFDRWTALIAAALQAANPFLMSLIQGYQFSDHVDIALLFWVELGVYFLTLAVRTGYWRYALLAGWAQGMAFLCKSYLAGIIFGLALSAWLLPICRLGKREEFRFGFTRLLGLLVATVLTVAPWLLYCMANYPDEYWHEDAQVWKHLHSDVENRAWSWDYVLTNFMFDIYERLLCVDFGSDNHLALEDGGQAASRALVGLRLGSGRGGAAPVRGYQDAVGDLDRRAGLFFASGLSDFAGGARGTLAAGCLDRCSDDERYSSRTPRRT